MEMPHIIITGNPVDGFHYYGPFKSKEDALEFAGLTVEGRTADYWLAPLFSPEEVAAFA